MQTFSALCARLGCPLNNIRSSWSAIGYDSQRALFTIWEDELFDGQFVLYPVSDRRPGVIPDAANRRNGARELHNIALYVAENPAIAAFGILCNALDVNAATRKRKSFDAKKLLRLQVRKNGDKIVGYVVGEVSVDSLAQSN